jgi:hypothetical protein
MALARGQIPQAGKKTIYNFLTGPEKEIKEIEVKSYLCHKFLFYLFFWNKMKFKM